MHTFKQQLGPIQGKVSHRLAICIDYVNIEHLTWVVFGWIYTLVASDRYNQTYTHTQRHKHKAAQWCYILDQMQAIANELLKMMATQILLNVKCRVEKRRVWRLFSSVIIIILLLSLLWPMKCLRRATEKEMGSQCIWWYCVTPLCNTKWLVAVCLLKIKVNVRQILAKNFQVMLMRERKWKRDW